VVDLDGLVADAKASEKLGEHEATFLLGSDVGCNRCYNNISALKCQYSRSERTGRY
jgi:hypothetical protein